MVTFLHLDSSVDWGASSAEVEIHMQDFKVLEIFSIKNKMSLID